MRTVLAILATLAIAGIAGVAIFRPGEAFVEGFIAGYEGHRGLPGCGWSVAKSDAMRAFANGPVSRSLNLQIVALSNIKTVSASPEKVACSADAVLNSGVTIAVQYSFTPASGSGTYIARTYAAPVL